MWFAKSKLEHARFQWNRLVVVLCLLTATTTLLAEDKPAPVNAKSVSQFGITWTFDREYPTGQFVNGDHWVVGPVSIVKIDPPSIKQEGGRIVNGSMLNPTIGPNAGFDTKPKEANYDASLNVAFELSEQKPLTVQPGSSLLSSISLATPEQGGRTLETVAILTVLDAAPPADAFRPQYMAGAKTIHRMSQVDLKRLPQLAVAGNAPTWEDVNQPLERPAIDFVPSFGRERIAPKLHGAPYGRDVSKQVGRASLMLIADFPPEQKRDTAIRLIQRGIDLYGIFCDWRDHPGERRFPWPSDGGHNSGRKWPMIFAGHMLGDEGMKSVGKTGKGLFHEDAQTVYITAEHVEATHSDKWNPPYGGKRGKQPYSKEMIGMPEWVGNHQPDRANAFWSGHPYRLGGNHNAFHGMALAVLAMDLKKEWNHDAWFDFMTRYIAIMSGKPDPFAAILGYQPVEGSTKEGGFEAWQLHWDKWSYDMWSAHQDKFYKLPTRSDLTPKN